MRLDTPKQPRESKVMKFVNLAGTAVMLNLVFLLACLPVVTIGPALCGLYSGVRYMIRQEGPVRGFWEGFKTRFFRMSIAGVIFTAIGFYFTVIINSAYEAWVDQGGFRDVVIYAIPAMIPMILLPALVVLNVYIPYTPTDWLRNGVNLSFKAPLWLLLSGVMLSAPIICLIFASDILLMAALVFLGFWFTLTAFASTLFLKDALVEMVGQYRQEHPEE